MNLYQKIIADAMLSANHEFIKNTPQPMMLGGRKARKYALPGYSSMSGPSSLSVGDLSISPRHNESLAEEDSSDEEDEEHFGIFKDAEKEEHMGDSMEEPHYKKSGGGKPSKSHKSQKLWEGVQKVIKEVVPKKVSRAITNKTVDEINAIPTYKDTPQGQESSALGAITGAQPSEGAGRKSRKGKKGKKMLVEDFLVGGELAYPEELLKKTPYSKSRMMTDTVKYKGGSARGALISKIMKEKGLKLGQASKYIKENGLK